MKEIRRSLTDFKFVDLRRRGRFRWMDVDFKSPGVEHMMNSVQRQTVDPTADLMIGLMRELAEPSFSVK